MQFLIFSKHLDKKSDSIVKSGGLIGLSTPNTKQNIYLLNCHLDFKLDHCLIALSLWLIAMATGWGSERSGFKSRRPSKATLDPGLPQKYKKNSSQKKAQVFLTLIR